MATARIQTATNAPSVNIKTTGADVTGVNIINRHSAIIYVKFYNSTVATFQDTPVFTIPVAASGGQFLFKRNASTEVFFSTSSGLCVRCVTDNTDAGNTAPATLPIIEIEYK